MTMGFQPRREPEPAGETEKQRCGRLDAEAAMLAAAKADLDAGRVIADGDADAWLDAWTRGEDVLLPVAPNR